MIIMDTNNLNITVTQGITVYSFISQILIVVAALFSAWLGAKVGGRETRKATIEGIERSHQKELERKDKIKSDKMQAFYQSIYTEIKTIWEAYMSKLGRDIENLKDEEPLDSYYPLTENEFPIYMSNLHLIGDIADSKIRELIVRTYAKGRGIVDSIRMNNQILREYTTWDWYAAESCIEIHGSRAKAEKKRLIEYAQVIKKQHFEIKPDVVILLQKLKEKLDIVATP